MTAGEEHKTQETLFDLLGEMKKRSLRAAIRSSVWAAASWGTWADLPPRSICGAFPAYKFRRLFYRRWIPRSGEKTAIDFEGVKNMIGVFSQPKKVFVDCDF